ncbi:MAG: sialidase family protein [Planctomycetota bacterium]|nr:sialidase family protein [Planctomycetota bacterium]
MHIEEQGLVFDATNRPANESVNCFTCLRRFSSGALIASFQSGAQKHDLKSTTRLCRSDDDGRPWTDLGAPFETSFGGVPGSIAGGEIVEHAPDRWQMFTTWFDRSDPERPLFDPVTQGVLHAKQLYCWSTDEGKTWSGWTELPTPGLTGTAICGTALQWSDGTIGYAFESYKEFDDPNPGRHAAWLAISTDKGETFPHIHLVAQHPEHKLFYWDQRLCPGKNIGDYYGAFWTHDLEQQQDLNVHFRKGNINDNSRPHEHTKATNITGQIAAPLLLDDGRLLLFVVDRIKPRTMSLWVSHDDGKTWPASERLVVHNHDEQGRLSQGDANVDFNEYWDDMAKWTFGHPAIVDLGNNTVLVLWYAGIPGKLSIHWARVNVAG